MIKAGIIGATGYAGNEIVRLLLGHKDVEVAWYGSRSYIDQKYADVYQNFFKLIDAKCMDDNMAALADEVEYQLKQQDIMPNRIEGYNSSSWILVDYGNVVVHIFQKDTRDFYSLERLWADGEQIDINEFLNSEGDNA